MGEGEEALRFLACIRKETMRPTPPFNLFRSIGLYALYFGRKRKPAPRWLYDITTLGAGKFMKVKFVFGRDLRLWLATPHKAVKA
ncbi:hypothetical protein [Prevotella conceptionensis]|uniref:hypothetical protein n=1 Tax=Prevotella conceptionensis TaxID=340486 RepID=UPI0002EE5BBA|nr:hypothetical protein [Prevotella conceptionensis]